MHFNSMFPLFCFHRVHEEIQAIRKSDNFPSGCLDSLLLDIDFRYVCHDIL